MPYTYKEEERKSEDQREEEEKKRKRHTKETERSPELESKKSEVEKGSDKNMAFGEAKLLTEVKYVKTPIKGMKASVKYEPVVKEELAVKMIEEERRKEQQMEEIRKEDVRKESAPLTAAEKTIAEAIEKERESKVPERTAIAKEIPSESIAAVRVKGVGEERQRLEATRSELSRIAALAKERAEIAQLVEQARLRGMQQPIKEIAQKLFENEVKKGIKPTVALGRVLMTLRKLRLLRKGDIKGITSFLKSLFMK